MSKKLYKDNGNLTVSACYLNNDGTFKKSYARKLWNYAADTCCDSFNGDLEDGELEHRIEGFRRMLNEVLAHTSQAK